ncbi:MAG: HAD family hydrolase [Bacteroidota bacterium]
MSQIKHILFDNDGTIVDSEVIAQQTMIRLMAEHDFVMSEQEYSHQFPGLLGRDILRILRDNHGFDAPANFMQRMQSEYSLSFTTKLKVIPGMWKLFRDLKVPKSIVSNGSVRHVEFCLRKVRLLSALDGHIFSAEHVRNPKPHPDAYTHALEQLGLKPDEALAVEDSPTGVKAAKDAGLFTVGFLGASHVHKGHERKLKKAGADIIAADSRELARFLVSKEVV